ncbi:MAG: ferritin-like domain-containing protein [Sphingomonadaceae bacterium]|nr:ferritin-like domain-containing protein [Sphingomonadaceae bacterium]
MTSSTDLIEAFDARATRRLERREFFRSIGMVGAFAGAMAIANRAEAQAAAPSDSDVLNFALNLEYLEAQFYAYAATGAGLPNSSLTGVGTQGAVIATGAHKVAFSDPAVASYAREIAADEVAHVAFLRSALGASAIAQPTIDISVGVNSAFSMAARAAGLINAAQSFDPYSTDENFLLGAFIFEDVGVTAYKGGSVLLSNKTYLEAAAGILAVEAYHAAIVRTTLYAKGMTTPALISATEAISNARDSLDGPSDDDQGVAPTNDASGNVVSNIVPLDANGIAFSRTVAQVHNIAYLTKNAATSGGFFPNGTNNPNNALRSSGAN